MRLADLFPDINQELLRLLISILLPCLMLMIIIKLVQSLYKYVFSGVSFHSQSEQVQYNSSIQNDTNVVNNIATINNDIEDVNNIDFDLSCFDILKMKILDITSINNNHHYYVKQFESIDNYIGKLNIRYNVLKENNDAKFDSFVKSVFDEKWELEQILIKLTQNPNDNLLSNLNGVRSRLQRLI